MIWSHLATFLWLRDRLSRNQARRSPVAALIARILRVLALVVGAVAFVVFLAIGMRALGDASPLTVLLVWDGLIAAFLFFWAVGLMAQLQRSELLSADRFLAFPVPPRVVFVVNYLGASVLAADVIIFGSAMIGLAVGLTLSRGEGMLALVPLAAAFLLGVTAATHQFQSWLAVLMANKRRRQQVIGVGGALLVVLFLAVSQVGPLTNRFIARAGGVNQAEMSELRRELQTITRARGAGRLDQETFARQSEEIREQLDPLVAATEAERRRLIDQVVLPAHRWIPLGWLPYGAMTLFEGRVLPALLGGLGLTALGLVSLTRSYRTTLRLSLGATDRGVPAASPAPAVAPAVRPRAPARAGAGLLEWRLPWVSEQASAIVLACFRSLTRAPEAKLMLLSPLIMTVIFGGMFFRRGGDTLFESSGNAWLYLRPLTAMGLFLLILLGLNQVAANQFGFDRDGFRAFVLGSAPRKDVLLGKNLALLPVAIGLGLVALAVLQLFAPMRLDHLVATLAAMLSTYLLYCVMTNLLSIYVPAPIKAGSLQPSKSNATLVLVNIAALFVFPLALVPALLALGMEAALDIWADVTGAPVFLVLGLAQAGLVTLVYLRALEWQGRLLQAREQQILDVVTTRAE